MKYTITDIRVGKNNKLGNRAQYIYAYLCDETGDKRISATLDYIITVSIKRGYDVTNMDEAKLKLKKHNEIIKNNLMDLRQKAILENYLIKFSKLANESWGDDDKKDLYNYWKGQVMGICKTITALGLENEINTEYYLKELL